MANVYATKNGSWSDNTVWSPAPPTSIDDVFASGFIVYVDTNIQVLSINTIGATGIGGGGTFRPNNGVVMTTNVVAGSTTCVTFGSASPNAFSLIGNVSGGNAANAFGINNSSTGSISITGNIVGGSVNAATHGINNTLSGVLTVFGNVSGSPFGTGGRGIDSSSANARINVLGNVHGGSGNLGIGGNVATIFINVTGNVIGGSSSSAIALPGGSFVTVVGNAIGGTGATHGIFMNNQSSFPPMTAIVTGNLISGIGGNSNGINSQSSSNLGPNLITVVGNISGVRGVGLGMSSGIAFVTGNVFGSSIGGVQGTYIQTGSATFVGNMYGGSGTSSHGIRLDTGTVTIFGTAFAGTGGNGVLLNGAGPLIVIGSVYGSNTTSIAGAVNNTTGTLIISGSAVGGQGSAAYGAFNNSTGILRVRRAVGNSWGLGYTTALGPAQGVFSNAQGSRTFVEELELGPRGQWPTGGVIFFTPNTRATSIFETDTFQNYSLIQSNSADNLVPPVSSVRQGTTYNLGLSTGTCIIPPVSSVAAGALVDNLTGIAALTPQTTWNYPTTASDVNSMGGRLRNALNTNSANSLINSFNP